LGVVREFEGDKSIPASYLVLVFVSHEKAVYRSEDQNELNRMYWDGGIDIIYTRSLRL
jgi:hypothetical protein